ncbi:hypothetical protein [Morganella morganii]|uniref:hypothetical protein n=1 Tax=Morganella morganii TaxID=582 RepID=UPI0021D3329D|nr:hypothetical protein [Morganella morganii]MCU6375998.1 hypothetical protein [Morganella morganii]
MRDDKDKINEVLNDYQAMLKGDLTALILIKEVLFALDVIHKDHVVSKHVANRLRIVLDNIHETNFHHDPSIVGAYKDALNLADSVSKKSR